MDPASTRPWTDEHILRALGEWGWAPNGSDVVDTADYRLVFRPASFDGVTSVERVGSTRPAAEIAGEVHALAHDRGVGEVIWNVYPTTTPPDLADHLLALGGTIRDEGGLMSLRVPDDGRLDVGPTDAGGCRFVAYVDDRPAGSGAIAVRDDGSASLFGAATYPELRGRGAYRAILAARTRWAHQHGVPVLLVSGRVATSAPIMERVGFTLHGYTRAIAVPTTSAVTPRSTAGDRS